MVTPLVTYLGHDVITLTPAGCFDCCPGYDPILILLEQTLYDNRRPMHNQLEGRNTVYVRHRGPEPEQRWFFIWPRHGTPLLHPGHTVAVLYKKADRK